MRRRGVGWVGDIKRGRYGRDAEQVEWIGDIRGIRKSVMYNVGYC